MLLFAEGKSGNPYVIPSKYCLINVAKSIECLIKLADVRPAIAVLHNAGVNTETSTSGGMIHDL